MLHTIPGPGYVLFCIPYTLPGIGYEGIYRVRNIQGLRQPPAASASGSPPGSPGQPPAASGSPRKPLGALTSVSLL